MYYCTSRNKMNSRSSMVERLNFRSLTGQELGFDVHRCSVSRTCLYWNRSSITGCYMNYIGRYEVHFHVSNQCLRLFETFGLDYACSCCYDSPTYLEDRIRKVCIYTDPRVSENLLYLRKLMLFGLGRWYMPVPGNFSLGSFVRCEYDVVVFE